MTQRAGWSYAIANSVARCGDVAFWTDVPPAMELIMAHVMAMEASGPIVYMGVGEGFSILGQGKVGEIRGVRAVRDVEVGREHRTLISEVIE